MYLVDEYTVDVLRLPERVLDVMRIRLAGVDRGLLAHRHRHVEGHVVAPFPHVPPLSIVVDAVRVRYISRRPNNLRDTTTVSCCIAIIFFVIVSIR